ncbi:MULTISPECIES: PDGLE domain-containing protein [unclassified Solwaraspora]|uniref:PDGLE domain-containing protein n=1 Tax=unclassified Solwaraspora TaxID=2627926 RepID=UPI00259AEC42|nr:PDGLE domain-containing protein [Solwaraspora sp. WMMA2056]WJK40278.1 PDGLE domain-containing protein [Solwaraspora sp. WMMA2056]
MKRNTGFILAGLLVSLLLAGVVSNFASGSPDGLDSASTQGCEVDGEEIVGGACMASGAREHELSDSPFADYGLAAVDNAFLGTAAAGVVGVLLTFAVAGGLFWLTRSRRPQEPADASTGER